MGEASIKRWETYYIQDNGQDEHIRTKCDEAHAEYNALQVHWKVHPADIYNGFRSFCLELFKQAACYLIEFAPSPLYLNKALFYADFKHFQLYEKSITGARYVHLELGPCPDQYQSIYQLFRAKEIFIAGPNHILKSNSPANLTVFSDSEREILMFVAKHSKVDGGKTLLNISHQEAAYTKTDPLELISYEYAKDLYLR